MLYNRFVTHPISPPLSKQQGALWTLKEKAKSFLSYRNSGQARPMPVGSHPCLAAALPARFTGAIACTLVGVVFGSISSISSSPPIVAIPRLSIKPQGIQRQYDIPPCIPPSRPLPHESHKPRSPHRELQYRLLHAVYDDMALVVHSSRGSRGKYHRLQYTLDPLSPQICAMTLS